MNKNIWVGVAAAIILILVLGLVSKEKSLNHIMPSEPSQVSASLNLVSQKNLIKVGEEFRVEVLLNTNGAKIDGLDLYKLKFDPQLAAVVDSDTQLSGVQITSLIPDAVVAGNSVDNAEGTIAFSQLAKLGFTFEGKNDPIASVTFKANKPGLLNLSLDYAPGQTNDTNVSLNGKDVLTSVINTSVTIQ